MAIHYPNIQLIPNKEMYSARCDNERCRKTIGPLAENVEIAAFILIEKYNWLIMPDFDTCYCSLDCLDKHDIDNIEKILDSEQI